MSTLTHLINDGDLCPLIFLICLLVPVGRLFVAHDSRLADWGLRVAAGTAIIVAGMTLSEEGINEAGPLARVVVRSLAAGALILGPTWIVLSVGAFFHAYYRRLTSTASARAVKRKLERERQQREAEELERKRRRDAEWERTRPEREHAAREEAERARIEADRKCQQLRDEASSQKRREEARLLCVLTFDKCGSTLAKTFPRKRLDQYFETYMTDAHSAAAVETRAKQLITMLEELASEHGHRSKAKFQSLADVATHFQQQREQIQSLPYGPDVVESLVVVLNQHEQTAISEFLKHAAR